jgi:hypothetical protein
MGTSDPPARRGRTGTVWIAWSGDDRADPDVEDPDEPGYSVSRQSDGEDDGEDDGWCEDGPAFTDLRDAIAWARRRSDAVIVRPEWDENTYYWAGRGIDRRGLPPLDLV